MSNNDNKNVFTDLDVSTLELQNKEQTHQDTNNLQTSPLVQRQQGSSSLPVNESDQEGVQSGQASSLSSSAGNMKITNAVSPQPNQSQGNTGAVQKSVAGLQNLLDALFSKGLINKEQFQEIRLEAINSNQSFEEVLMAKGVVTSRDIARTYAEMKNIGYIDVRNVAISPEVLQLLPKNIASEHSAVVFENLAYKAKVAMADPLDLQRVKYIESVLGKEVESFYAAKDDIQSIIDTKYGAQISSEVDEALEEVGDSKLLRKYSAVSAQEDAQDSAPIIRIVNMMLDYAIKHKASDIHVEPRDKKVVVRFRIRGVLEEKLTIPMKLLPAVVTRIKILSDLKIDEHRIPQDGRFPVNTTAGQVDVRVSIMPSIHGEKIVMRILDKTQGILDLDTTGMRGGTLQRMKSALSKTQGIILVTGPTGSGKTQTLASSLHILNTPEVNIVTLEDPVEIRINGANQVQVNAEVGLTFASGLRSILRQDPDIIMVGEIRDRETAALAVQSALVGRLVMSTVHTNSAAGAFIRLIDMGIEPFLLTSTVNIVIGQRLVRTLSDAARPYEAPPEVVQRFHEVLDPLGGISITRANGEQITFNKDTQSITLYEPVSTPQSESGYTGRTGIFEALHMSERIGDVVMKKASITDIQQIAVEEGMITMEQDGFIKALEGVTTIEEVLRVRKD